MLSVVRLQGLQRDFERGWIGIVGVVGVTNAKIVVEWWLRRDFEGD